MATKHEHDPKFDELKALLSDASSAVAAWEKSSDKDETSLREATQKLAHYIDYKL